MWLVLLTLKVIAVSSDYCLAAYNVNILCTRTLAIGSCRSEKRSANVSFHAAAINWGERSETLLSGERCNFVFV